MRPQLRGAVVTIGNFDGVHLGHQAMFQTLCQLAEALGGAPTLVLTFEPHPQKLLNPKQAPERMTGVRGKARWIEKKSVDALFVLRFTRKLAAYQPEQFVRQILVEGLAVRAVLVGNNFRFGAGGKGTFANLQTFGEQFGFHVYSQPLIKNDTQIISSTRIREGVKAGQFTDVARLLGREFEIEARVTPGHKRGQALGFPTANIALAGMLHPPPGVYIVEACVNDRWLPAVANLGHNPTFGHVDLRLEVHILAEYGAQFVQAQGSQAHFAQDIYRHVLRVRFLQHVRDEIKFSDQDALKQQIAEDVLQARVFFAHFFAQQNQDREK